MMHLNKPSIVKFNFDISTGVTWFNHGSECWTDAGAGRF